MFDRNVQFPNRYRLQKVDGTDDIYDVIPVPGIIYNEGTLINKASLLKDPTAELIGLTKSAVPDDMFNVLSHAGDLHVWRRTVTLSQPGYSLSSEKSDGTLANGDRPGYTNVSLDYGDSITVSPNGDISINNKTSTTVSATGSAINVTNKFIQILDYNGNGSGSPEYANSDFPLGTILFVTGSMVISGSRIYVTKYKTVTAYKAETTVDYPVSTNRNAYQEESGEQPAGYTLGEVVEKDVVVVGFGSHYNREAYSYGDTPSVNEDGTLDANSLPNTITLDALSSGANIANSTLRGKFIARRDRNTNANFPVNTVFFIPRDATFVYKDMNSGDTFGLHLDKYQIVTGYPAIPAGTTIEYLGNLGDKVRMQIISYVGTGTYGASNPNSLTFDFAPDFVIFLGESADTSQSGLRPLSLTPNDFPVIDMSRTPNTYTMYCGPCSENGATGAYGKKSSDGKTLTWYNSAAITQLNYSGHVYVALAIKG